MLGKKLYDSRKRLESTLKKWLRPVSELLTVRVKLPKRQMMVALIGLLILGSALCFLMGCAPQTRVVRPPLPPQAQAREVPSFQGQTYRDVIQYVIELKEAAQQSEADKAAIRRAYGQ